MVKVDGLVVVKRYSSDGWNADDSPKWIPQFRFTHESIAIDGTWVKCGLLRIGHGD